MPQAAKPNLLLYADHSYLMCQHKDIAKIEKILMKTENICDWFVDNKLSIHFSDDKTKSIILTSKQRAKNICKLNIRYKELNIKQQAQVIEKILNEDFENICDWFVDNKLSIHFNDDKTKSIILTSKQWAKNICKLNIRYKELNIKQQAQVMDV